MWAYGTCTIYLNSGRYELLSLHNRVVSGSGPGSTPDTVRSQSAAQCNGGGALAYNSLRAGAIAVASQCTFVPTPFIDSAPNIQTHTTHRYAPFSLLILASMF